MKKRRGSRQAASWTLIALVIGLVSMASSAGAVGATGVVTGPTVVQAAGNTTYTWTLSGGTASHVIINTCLGNTAISTGGSPDSAAEWVVGDQSTGRTGYKWEVSGGDLPSGATFSLTFSGSYDASGSADWISKKGSENFPFGTTGGPNCSAPAKKATIQVAKDIAAGSDQTKEFAFSASGATWTIPQLGDGDSSTLQLAEPATVTVSETVPTGWNAPSVSCTTDTGTSGGTSATFGVSAEDIAAEKTITCTFTNSEITQESKKATIQVVKDIAAGSDQTKEFAFSASGATWTIPQLGDGDSSTLQLASPATVTVTETVPTGWNAPSVSCATDTGTSGGTSATFGVSAEDIAAEKTITCTFTNSEETGPPPPPPPPPPEPRVDVRVDKVDSVDPVVAGSNYDYVITVTNNGPDPAHNVTVVDTLPSGVSKVSVTTTKGSCVGSDVVTCLLGTLASGQTETITITVSTSVDSPDEVENPVTVSTTSPDTDPTNNSDVEPTVIVKPQPPAGAIVVEKQTLPRGASEQFGFTGAVQGSLGDNDTLTQTVPAGTYTVTEAEEEGWELSSIACTGSASSGDVAQRTATFVVDPGEVVKCTFTNTETAVLPSRIDRDKPQPSVDAVAPEQVRAAPVTVPYTGYAAGDWLAAAIVLVLGGATLMRVTTTRLAVTQGRRSTL